MKRKIILTYDDDDMNAEAALARMSQVAAQGYISTAAGMPHYCWCTRWEFPGHSILALAKIKKNAASADSIQIVKELDKKELDKSE